MFRKTIKIIVIALISLLLLMLILPFLFKDRIIERVKHEINEQVEADVSFGSFGLSLIRQFPQLTVWVRDVRVVGQGAFAGDTLADMGRIMVSADVLKAVRGDLEISRIRLDEPNILLKMLADGQVNWNIMAAAEEVETPVEEAPADFSLALKRVEIRSGKLAYLDDKFVTYIHADDINGVFRGDLSMALTNISTQNATIGSFSLRYDQWPILSRVAVHLTADMDADLDRFVFTFRDNQIRINELPLVFEGMVGWPVDDLEMDFTFGSARSDFASFLSILPAMYTDDFADLTSAGSMKLEGHVKGTLAGDVYPGFGLTIEVDNGMFNYPGLPASVDKVQLQARISNPGVDMDLTVVDVPVFSMELAGAPVEARFRLENPISDPGFDVKLAGQLDLSQVETFYPLGEGYVLRGMIKSDLEMRGRMSVVERHDLGALHAAGQLLANELYLEAPVLEEALEVQVADFRFSPEEVRLDAFDMRLGSSDLSASGSILNLPGYLFDGQLLRGHFNTKSAMFDLNKLMDQLPEEDATADAGDLAEELEEEEDTPAGASSLSVIRIPANIDFTLESAFDKVLFGKLEISDVSGVIQVAEEQVNMERLRLNLLGGALELTGIYDTSDQLPWVNLGLDILGFDIAKTFESFVTARVLAPIGEYTRGAFSASLQLSSLLDEGLQPLLGSLKGSGSLRSSSVVLENTPSMSMLASQLHMDQFREISLSDLLLSFAFSDGRLELPPVDMRFGGIEASVMGVTYFDQRISYVMNMQVPRSLFGGRANQVLDDLVSRASAAGIQLTPGETVPLDVQIGGTFRRPEVSFSMAEAREGLEQQFRREADRLLRDTETRIRDEMEQARDQVETEVQDRIDEAEERARAEMEARAAQIMEEAHRQAATLRNQAASAADAVRRESREQADRLQQEASGQGPIAQAAARRTAEQLVREADRRANQIEAEAERNIQKLLDEASQQAERVRGE